MNKSVILSLLLIVGFLSCKNSGKEIDKLGIARKYYKALDSSNHSEMALLLADSLVTKESKNFENRQKNFISSPRTDCH